MLLTGDDGSRVGIEVTELVNGKMVARARQLKEQGLPVSYEWAPWTPASIATELSRIIAEKDSKLQKANGQFDKFLLAIMTDEPIIDEVIGRQAVIQSRAVAELVDRAFLILSYQPQADEGQFPDRCPVLEVPLHRDATRACDAAGSRATTDDLGDSLMFKNMVMDIPSRIQAAKKKTERVVEHLLYLVALHESNAIVVYSDKLSSQIPMSYAANAFNVFQRSSHQFEIVRLCALWDSAGEEKENILTVIELIDDPAIIEALAQQTKADYGATPINPSEDPETQALLQDNNEKRGEERAQKVREQLPKTIAAARALRDSPRLLRIMNLRHKHLAHSLSKTHRERTSPVAPMKYGDEREVLEDTFPIVQDLYRCVNGVGFSFEDSRKIEREYAQSLWTACTFNISVRRQPQNRT